MAIARAIAKYVPMTPRKTRQVSRLVKGKRCVEALAMLRFVNKRAAQVVGKVVASAVANATKQPGVKEEDLVITLIRVDQGPRSKRYRAGAMGRAMPYERVQSHITVELDVANQGVKS